MTLSIGIVGGGFVGAATARVFMEHAAVKVFDIDPRRRSHDLVDVLGCDFVFICLPTPANLVAGGHCDLGVIEAFFDQLCEQPPGTRKHNGVLVLKSTVPPGTTARLARKLELADRPARLLHSPEFLTARASFADAHCPSRNIIGSPLGGRDYWSGGALERLYQQRFPGVPVMRMHSTQSELVKMICNNFFAMKVLFFNQMRAVTEGHGVLWESVREGVLADGRIAHAHTSVPGPDGLAGFGGACLSKDLLSMTSIMQGLGIDTAVFDAIWKVNCELRPTAFDEMPKSTAAAQ